MPARLSIIAANAPHYRKGRKLIKTRLLNELMPILCLNRKYLALKLRATGQKVHLPNGTLVIGDPFVNRLSSRGRKKTYLPNRIVPPLSFLWQVARCIGSRHLVAFIRANHDKLFPHPNLAALPTVIRHQLVTISPATVDRLLWPVRQRVALRERYPRTPHTSRLRRLIPVESYHNKPKDQFGYLELDLVFHSGDSTAGEFAHTLTVTEITTGWTELRALRNKAQTWLEKALLDILMVLPFRPTALHSDNGSEFFNNHLARLAQDWKLPFTRSRANQKNDAPYVESKNYSLVRVYSGYRRYDTAEELAVLRELDELVSVKHNYFMPTMKIVDRYRLGPKVIRRCTLATPLSRLLDRPEVAKTMKRQLGKWRAAMDFYDFAKRIEEAETRLDTAYRDKYHPGKSLKEGSR